MKNISVEDWKEVPTAVIEDLIKQGTNELNRRHTEERAKALEAFKKAFCDLRDMGIRVYGIYDYSDQLTFNDWDDFYFD